jgi:cytochrome c-type biogenesis protein CcmH/NrfF
VPRSALERQLEGEILCTCGCRRPLNNCGMPNCDGHASQTAKLRKYLSEGKDHDAVVASFVQEFGGQDILAAPIDKGFNRLAWFFPYLIGATGAASVAVVAFRWSRREDGEESPAARPEAESPDLTARLDDELRDLD